MAEAGCRDLEIDPTEVEVDVIILVQMLINLIVTYRIVSPASNPTWTINIERRPGNLAW